MGKVFSIPRSTFFTPSPKNVLRPKVEVLKSAVVRPRKADRGRFCCEVAGLLMLRPKIDGSSSTGRVSLMLSRFKSTPVVMTVNGVPFDILTTAETCHPPKTWPSRPFSSWKKGRRYVPYIVKRCGVWKRERPRAVLVLFPVWFVSPAPTNVASDVVSIALLKVYAAKKFKLRLRRLVHSTCRPL